MSKSDYYRPAPYQINSVYRCVVCGQETDIPSMESATTCGCGGRLECIGESHPASADDWDEERGPDGEWRQRW